MATKKKTKKTTAKKTTTRKASAKKTPSKKKTTTKVKGSAPKARAKAKAAPAPEATKAAPPKEPKQPKLPREQARDPRLPAPGTVIQKRDRQGTVRCECTVEADGIRYNNITDETSFGFVVEPVGVDSDAALRLRGIGGAARARSSGFGG